MSVEFTGERVIPGQVDPDLWNEHLARYAFAARLAKRKRVLDLGCGAGYGSAELAHSALSVLGLDLSSDAVGYARAHYPGPNISFLQASCTALPLADHTYDLIVAFEVIEHLSNWRDLLEEARRVMAPGGQFVVSTPNKSYYAESRQLTGPNPYHEHEFEFDEFSAALAELFPHVSLFLENHSDSMVFKPVYSPPGAGAELRVEGNGSNPTDAHFFIAVCALAPQLGAPTFVYLPTSANVLRERELHIARLERELETKNQWLDQAHREHQELLDLHHQQAAQLEERTRWGLELTEKLKAAGDRIVQLQEELARQQKAARDAIDGYEAAILKLETELQETLDWGVQTRDRLTAELEAKVNELSKCVELLHAAEATIEERTLWAQALETQVRHLQDHIDIAKASKWLRLGRKIGIGPELRST